MDVRCPDIIKPQLELVTARVTSLARDGPSPVGEAAGSLATRPGKMVRPTLLLLAALAGPRLLGERAPRRERARQNRLIAAATAFELLHLASLTHDDVMDSSSLRRGAPSAWSRWGPAVAILTGDQLFGKAVSQAGLAGRRAFRSLVRVIEALVAGQAMELEATGNRLGRRAYMALATAKTAVFCAESCALGASLGGAGCDVTSALRKFGLALGQAYQVADDLLDWREEAAETGKPRLIDLRDGHLTLPVIIGLGRRPVRLGRRIAALNQLNSAHERRELLEDIRRELAGVGAFEEAAVMVRRKTARAVGHLALLPGGPPRWHLEALAETLAGRTA